MYRGVTVRPPHPPGFAPPNGTKSSSTSNIWNTCPKATVDHAVVEHWPGLCDRMKYVVYLGTLAGRLRMAAWTPQGSISGSLGNGSG